MYEMMWLGFVSLLGLVLVLAVWAADGDSPPVPASVLPTAVPPPSSHPYRAPQPTVIQAEAKIETKEQAAIGKVMVALSTISTLAPATSPPPVTQTAAATPAEKSNGPSIVAMYYEQERQARLLKAARALDRALNPRRRRGGWGSW